MSKVTSESAEIQAGLSEVATVLFEIERYPEWTTGITAVDVISRNSKGEVESATLTIDAGVIKDEVTLSYDWNQGPLRLSFSMLKGKFLNKMSGAYVLDAISPEKTKVTYELSVGTAMFIPAMMITKQEKSTIEKALGQLKERIEGSKQ